MSLFIPTGSRRGFNHPAYLKLYAHRSLEEAEQTIATLLKFISVQKPNPKALDIACGSGRHAVALAEKRISSNSKRPFFNAPCRSKKSWQSRKISRLPFTHTDMREIAF
jgi:hypothetical protein